MGKIKTTELLNPLNDVIFKALFGKEQEDSKLILINFLNSILSLENQEKITSIIHLNPINIAEHEEDKSSILDIKVKTQQEERINIEIQINNADDFRKRSLFYWSKLYGGALSKGEPYHKLKRSIVINIMDFNLITETGKYHTEYLILEKDEHFPLTKDLSIHYLELPKFDSKKDLEKMEAIEMWLSFLKWAGKLENKEKPGKLIERSELLKMAKEMLEQISADEAIRERFFAREKARRDAISQVKYAELMGMEKGMEKGIEKGMEKGIEKGRLEGMEKGKREGLLMAAKNLIKLGMPIKQISLATGLKEEELNKLAKELED